MRLSLKIRQWLTACAIGFLLLSQQAVAAYVCTASLQDMAQAASAMPDCELSAADAVSALCLKHCSSGGEHPAYPDIDWTALATPSLHYLLAPSAFAPPAIAVRHHVAYAPSPPLIIRLQRFQL